MRGVYYTPEPVVSYIARSIDYLLKSHFGKPQGLADPSVLILDPAVGTATFLYMVIDEIHDVLLGQGQAGLWNDYVAEKLLPRIFGFELLMASYAMAHLKLGLLLKETGYQFEKEQRLGIYLTNTLEEAFKKSEVLAGFNEYIVDEANAAAEIKKEKPIMVVLGNPPYSVSSLNRGEWIDTLLEDYKKGLHEKKLNIDDDYIKFIRFAQWRIEQTGYGILGFITNNSYLDGLTHRRMRECLLESFSDIYILNLHGSSRRGEKAPENTKDANVFDIQQGVAIGIFVKETTKSRLARLWYADMWGPRGQKYAALSESDVANTNWQELSPIAPHFFFIPKDFARIEEYQAGTSIRQVFTVNGTGIKTERDSVTIHFTEASLRAVLGDFMKLEESELKQKYHLERDSRDWKVSNAKRDITSSRANKQFIRAVHYRPFDMRLTYYTGTTRGFIGTPGRLIADCFLHPNIGLVAKRQNKREPFSYIFVTKVAPESCLFESAYANNIVFPLLPLP